MGHGCHDCGCPNGCECPKTADSDKEINERLATPRKAAVYKTASLIRYFSEGEYDLARGSEDASGWDLKAVISAGERVIHVRERWAIRTGIFLQMPRGVEGQVRSRSGLARDHGITVLNAPGTIDSDFRGEICVLLWNACGGPYAVKHGDRIAQLVFAPVLPAWVALWQDLWPRLGTSVCDALIPTRVPSLADLSRTERGVSGFGSTGR